MLSVLRFAFQAVQGASWRKGFVPRLLDPGEEFLGWGRRGSGFTCEAWFRCCADCTQQHPGNACMAGCRQSRTSNALSWSSPSEVPCSLALQLVPSAAPTEVWLGNVALHPPSQQPAEGWSPLPHPFPLLLGMGRTHNPLLSAQAVASGTMGARLCPHWVLVSPRCHWAEEPFTECWNHGIRCYFYANINQWANKGISHLHAFWIGACLFGVGLTSILAALLMINTSALTEPSW